MPFNNLLWLNEIYLPEPMRKSITFFILALFFGNVLAQQDISAARLAQKLVAIKEPEMQHRFLEGLDTEKQTYFELLECLSAEETKKKHYDNALILTNALASVRIYKSFQPNTAFDLLKEFHLYIANCKNTKEVGKYYELYGEALTYLEKLESSITILSEGIDFLEKAKDSSLYEFGYVYLKSAENLAKLNKLVESANHFKKSADIFEYQKDTLFYLWSKNGLATLLGRNGLFEEARKERRIIYTLGPKIGEEQVVAMAHLQAGIESAFNGAGEEEELYHLRNAVSIKNEASEIQNVVSIFALGYASMAFARAQKLDSAKAFLNRLNEKMAGKPFNSQMNTTQDFAEIYISVAEGNLKRAKTILDRLKLRVDTGKDATNNLRISLLLSDIEERQGNQAASLAYYKTYLKLNDSIKDASARNRFAYVQTAFETEEKDLEIEKQKANIVALDIKNKFKAQWILFGGLGLLGVFSFIYIIRSRNFALQKQGQQKVFSQELIQTQERERIRIAKDLHDNVGQRLLLLKNSIMLNNDIATEKTTMITEAIKEVREIAHNLHPFQFEKLGLEASLKNMIKTFQKNSLVFYSETIKNTANQIPKEKEIIIFRMLQECLANVEKHADATACKLSSEITPKFLKFQLKDNGNGFDMNNNLLQNGLGMRTLKERAHFTDSVFKIISTPGSGTTVHITIPRK